MALEDQSGEILAEGILHIILKPFALLFKKFPILMWITVILLVGGALGLIIWVLLENMKLLVTVQNKTP